MRSKYEPSEFEVQERDSQISLISEALQAELKQIESATQGNREQSDLVDAKMDAMSEPVKELTPSDDLEKVKMTINQLISLINKTLR